MNDIPLSAGYSLTVAQVYLIVTTWLFPILWGFIGSKITSALKAAEALGFPSLSENARAWAMRGVVAFVCAVLNLLGVLALHQPVTVALVLQTVVSYLSAVTTYEHEQTPQPAPGAPGSPTA